MFRSTKIVDIKMNPAPHSITISISNLVPSATGILLLNYRSYTIQIFCADIEAASFSPLFLRHHVRCAARIDHKLKVVDDDLCETHVTENEEKILSFGEFGSWDAIAETTATARL